MTILAPIWAQFGGLGPTFLRNSPRNGFGRNLQHMAPFGIPTTGFCMVFQCATLVFSTPGTISGTPDRKFGARLGRGPCWHKNGGQKNMTLWKKWSPMRFHGDLCEGNGLYGTQEAFGQAHFLPNPTRKTFYKDFPISAKIIGHPGSLVGSLLAL